jgi:hypothetical protein
MSEVSDPAPIAFSAAQGAMPGTADMLGIGAAGLLEVSRRSPLMSLSFKHTDMFAAMAPCRGSHSMIKTSWNFRQGEIIVSSIDDLAG